MLRWQFHRAAASGSSTLLEVTPVNSASTRWTWVSSSAFNTLSGEKTIVPVSPAKNHQEFKSDTEVGSECLLRGLKIAQDNFGARSLSLCDIQILYNHGVRVSLSAGSSTQMWSRDGHLSPECMPMIESELIASL